MPKKSLNFSCAIDTVGKVLVLSCLFALLQVQSITAADLIQSGPLRLEENLIMDGYGYAYGIDSADLDGDGDIDLTSADALPHNKLYWFENDGEGNFTRRLIQENDPERLERHVIGDMDGDGHPDVVIVKNLEGSVLWFRNPGSQTGQLWQRNIIADRTFSGAYDVAEGDFNGNGRPDVAAAGWIPGHNFAWFENDGTPANGPWVKRSVDADVAESRMIRSADVNGDGKLDLVGTASAGDLVVWYENHGNPAVTPFTKHVIDGATARPMHGDVVDMDGDGDVDVLVPFGMNHPGDLLDTPLHQVAWYENDGTTNWSKHVIQQPLPDAFEAQAADMDGDGDMDVVVTSFGQIYETPVTNPGFLAWLENTGNPKDQFRMHMIKDDWEHVNQVIIADLDGNGLPDVAACAERYSLDFRWFRNLGAAPPSTLAAVHSVQNNPTSEGWTMDGNGGTLTPGNDGMDHWQISTPSETYYQYNHSLTAEDVSGNWSATAVVKPITVSITDNSTFSPPTSYFYSFQNTFLMVWTEEGAYGVGFNDTGLWGLAAGSTANLLSEFIPDPEKYYTLQLQWRDSDSVDVYLDGTLVGNIATFYAPVLSPQINFGDGNGSPGYSQTSNWNYVAFNTEPFYPIVSGDADKDGIVDENDVAILAGN